MNEAAEVSAMNADVRGAPTQREIDESWRRCCKRLRAELGENVFTSWFGRLTLDSIEEGRAHFSVPTRFLKSWIEAHYSDRILAALGAELGGIASIVIGMRSSMGAPIAPPTPTISASQPKAIDAGRPIVSRTATAGAPRSAAMREEGVAYNEAFASSPLDRRLTFVSFLVGRSNQLAYSAAQRVVEDRSGAAGVQSALCPLGGGPRQDPSAAGDRARRFRAGAKRHLSDGRAFHVRLCRRPAVAHCDRLQGSDAIDRPADHRRRAVLARQGVPERVRPRAQRAARTPAARWWSPPIARRGISSRSTNASARDWPAACASKWRRSTSR